MRALLTAAAVLLFTACGGPSPEPAPGSAPRVDSRVDLWVDPLVDAARIEQTLGGFVERGKVEIQKSFRDAVYHGDAEASALTRPEAPPGTPRLAD